MPVPNDQSDTVHRNDYYDWDRFDAQDYFEHNYRSMRGDDAVMLSLTCDWFDRHAAGGGLDAVDVGSGTNLYPALALLRHSASVTLYEHSIKNVQWLEAAVRHLPESWKAYANRLEPGLGSGDVDLAAHFESVRQQVREKCVVQRGSIFDLPPRRWQIGTMFFVAESMTEDEGEFRLALDSFFGALKPGAAFVAAFMAESTGYDVGGVRYPAVSLSQQRLEAEISERERVAKAEICPVKIDPMPIRPGYTGYLMVRGTIKD